MVVDQLPTVAVAVAAAVMYSVAFYAKKRARDDTSWELSRFVATVAVGLGVGLGAALLGVEVTPQYVETQLLMYAGLVALLEATGKTVYRAARREGWV